MTGLIFNNQSRDCEIDVSFCDYQVNCEECPFYMDDCDGDPEKMDSLEEY